VYTEAAKRSTRCRVKLLALLEAKVPSGEATAMRQQAVGRLARIDGSNRWRLCENSLPGRDSERTTHQNGDGCVFSTSPRVERPPKLLCE
jgi:hypothetical protein